MMGDSVIARAADLTKSYWQGGRELQVLKGIDLEIRVGEFLAIVGPSGTGKSTLLHLLGLMDTPTSGTLELWGQNALHLGEREKSAWRSQRVGFVFQFMALLPEFTMLENVMMPMMIQNSEFRIQNSESKAKELLEQVGLQNRMDHYPYQLSGGEQQRAAVARAFANDPQLILADEPTGNLDYDQGSRVLKILDGCASNKDTAVILVTHNEMLARQADRVIHLLNGGIVQ